jgi:small subunit ribosomal protein S27e
LIEEVKTMSRGVVPKPRSKFLRVRCPDCSNVQVLFNKSAMEVKCQVCGATLARPTGGKSEIRGEVTEVLR